MDEYAHNHRERMRRKSRESYSKEAEIGPLPEVVDRERKEECRTDLLKFLETYFPNSTGLHPFSDDHKRMIGRLQRCILFGGMMVEAVYRGFAKTTIGENACLWAALYGHRLLIPLVGADADASNENMDSIKGEIESNDLLYEDFPEVCHPVRMLEGRTQRAATQTLDGELTKLGWTADEIVLPDIPGADSAGVCIKPQSLMAYSRGIKHKMPDGRQVRPEFVFIDDPQTDDSAATPGQVEKRMNKLRRTILKSAGHAGSIAVYIAATIIEKDDMIDQLLDPHKNPQWQGERCKMVKSWSHSHEDMWLNKYAEIRHGYDRNNSDDILRAKRDAMLFYQENREVMDSGCEVSWDYCVSDKEDDYELSAIQHAYNMLIDDGPDVFAAECQNEPPDRTSIGEEAIEVDDVISKAVGPDPGVVPGWASHVTAFIDVQGNSLWYVVAAWADDFTGCIIEYGAYPEQNRVYYTKSDIKRTLARVKPGAGVEGQIWHGLAALTERLMGRTWEREDGIDMDIELCLIDEGFQTPTVYEFCKRSDYRQRIMPAKGMAIGASSKPFEEYQKRPGETLGEHWRRTKVRDKAIRHVIHNPNYWKTFVWNRVRVPIGDPGCLTIHKGTANQHRMLADHIAASEYPDRKTSQTQGRTVEEWQQRPRRDNDLLDCVVGASVAASILGCDVDTVRGESRKQQRRIKRSRRRPVRTPAGKPFLATNR